MKSSMVGFCFLFLFSVITYAQEAEKTEKVDKPGFIKVLNFQIYDPIEDVGQVEQFESRLKEAMGKTNQIVVISIDCPGGSPALVDRMYKALQSFPGKKIAYVDYGRYGGVYGWPCGLILACDTIIVNPKSSIGTKCNTAPKLVNQCKGIPCSDVYPKMLDFWMDGISLTPDEKENADTYVETFTMVAQKRTNRRGETEELFIVHSSKTQSNRLPARAPVEQKKDDGQFMLASAKAQECGLANYVTEDPRSVLTELAADKNTIEVKIPLKSGLNTIITQLFKRLDDLTDIKDLSNLNDDRIDRRITCWNKKKAAANAAIRILENNPDLQYLLFDELLKPLNRTPFPGNVMGYSIMVYPDSNYMKNWAVDRLKLAVEKYEIHVDSLRDEKKNARKMKSKYDDDDDDDDHNHKSRKSKKYIIQKSS